MEARVFRTAFSFAVCVLTTAASQAFQCTLQHTLRGALFDFRATEFPHSLVRQP
jgi:hypothetical protein